MRANGRAGIAVLAAMVGLALVPAPAHAAFPGRNGLIAWTHPTSLVTDSEIFVMRPDGSGARQLSRNEQNDFFPAWSPDGRWIAFESSSATDVDVWLMRADGAGERNLTNDPGWADRYPAWSPDGTQIAFSRQSPFTGKGGVWVIGVDGSNPRRLTGAENADSQPAWSPDGRWIAFSSDRDGNLELYAIRPDGSALTRLTRTPANHEENPNWSPDGSMLAYDACEADSYPCPGNANYDVFSIDGAGIVTRLTTDPAIDANPAWSPNGAQIVFRSDRTGSTQIWKMRADGSEPVQLTLREFKGGVDPDWQPLPG